MTSKDEVTSERVRTQVERIRRQVLARHGVRSGDEVGEGVGNSRIADVAQLANVSAHWGIASDVRGLGPVIVLYRRVIRLLLRWYINPIVEQQNRFNAAVVRAMYHLQAENDDL